jgi:APA family basic amino acid/polyamine antiporter
MGGKDETNRLRQRIGFWGLLAMCVGLNIGGALFALTSLAAGLTGPSLPLAMLVSAIPAMLAVIPYGVLTSALPTTSATYRYAQLVHPSLALVCMLTLAICIVIGGQPLFALAFGKYLSALVPLNPVITGLVVLTVFYVINLLGIDLTARIQTLLFVVLIAALVLFVVLGVPRIDPVNLTGFFPKGVGGVFAAAGLLFTFCAGGFFVVDLGGEVIQARSIFPKVLFLGMILAVVLYLFIHTVTVGVISWSDLKGQSLIAVAETFMPPGALVFFIIGGALVACATTINVIFSVVSRGLMVVSAEGLLPAFLGRVNQRYGTPHWGLTVAYLICVVSLIGIPSLMFFGSMLNLGLVFAITVVAMSGWVLPQRFPFIYSRSSLKTTPGRMKAVCGVVVVMNCLIFVFFCLAIGKASLVFGGIVCATVVYSLGRRMVLKSIHEEVKCDQAWCEKISTVEEAAAL